MLQTVPFPIGRLLKMLAQQQAGGAGNGQPVPQGEFPVNIAEFARMTDTSNDAIRGYQAERDGVPSSVLETERTGRARVPDLGDRGRVEARPGTRVSQEINDVLERTRQRGGPMGWGVSGLDAMSGEHPGDMLAGPGAVIGRGAAKVGTGVSNAIKRMKPRGNMPLGIGGARARPAPPPRPGGTLDRASGGAGGGRWEDLYEPPPRSVLDEYLEILGELGR